MAKRDPEKATHHHHQQGKPSSTKADSMEATTGLTISTAESVSTISIDSASQYSKDSGGVDHRKHKSWTKSLKKATSSIIYMAMPPASAESVPMVVAQTPMSPDRLVPSLHSPLLQQHQTHVISPVITEHPSELSRVNSCQSESTTTTSKQGQDSTTSATASSSTASLGSSSSVSSSSRTPLWAGADVKPGHTGNNASNPNDLHRKQSSQSSTTSSNSSKTKKSIKGKERGDHDFDSEKTMAISLEEAESETVTVKPRQAMTSPPSSPPGQTTLKQVKGSQVTMATVIDSPDHEGVVGEIHEALPSPPPSPQKSIPKYDTAFQSLWKELEVGGKLPYEATAVATTEHIGLTTTSISLDQDGSKITSIPHELGLKGDRPATSKSRSPPSISQSLLKGTHVVTTQISKTAVTKASPGMSKSIVKPTLNLNTRQSSNLAPWIWHQDGVRHQRLESHQILTKEQVFEQFHLDLEQDGPNGFFLFKIVKRFKRHTPPVETVMRDPEFNFGSTLDSASTPTSILDNIDAVSVSQKLKRQLLIQKRKDHQSKTSGIDEEDKNLEALLNMSNNNMSLQNLNSSLQEVIDAVDSLKRTQEWANFTEPSPSSSMISLSQERALHKSYAPDSDNEYTSRDKDAYDVETLERDRGVYATGRLDGMNLLMKKRYKTMRRRSSTSAALRKPNGSHQGGSEPGAQAHEGSIRAERRGSEVGESSASANQFKKQAVRQLHIYSRNGLKFKFDVMDDNELHFVEASKKYTFMDPLPPNRQPELGLTRDKSDALSPLRTSTTPLPAMIRRTSTGTTASNLTDAESIRSRHRSDSSKTKRVLSSSASSSSGTGASRRVYVTRLGRHTLLTYAEYKVLTKSASSFTLGAKLLIQRSIAVATPSFYNSSGGTHGHSKESSTQGSGHEVETPASTASSSSTTVATSTPMSNPSSTPASEASGDYFSLKKRQSSKGSSITGFASKAVAAIKSPSTPLGTQSKSSTSASRPIVTPYNPAEYKNKALTLGTQASESSESHHENGTAPTAIEIPSRSDSIIGGEFPVSSPPAMSPTSPSSSGLPPIAPSSSASASGSPTTGTSLSTTSYGITTIKRQGNQAGIKFQHLFVTVHQRLQKLELDNGSFYGSPLVQWTIIDDPDELRWWRDAVGIQMIGRLEDDGDLEDNANSDNTTGDALTPSSTENAVTANTSSLSPTVTEASIRSSYVSAQSYISDATSTCSSSSNSLSSSSSAKMAYRSNISVERLGYRFLRVSGMMGTLKVTVTEETEARAVALAVKAEMLKQKRRASNGGNGASESWREEERPWVEMAEFYQVSEDDEGEDKEAAAKAKEDSTEGEINYYDKYEYDASTGRTRLKPNLAAKQRKTNRVEGMDRFSHRKWQTRQRSSKPMIERMTMIVAQARVFKGDWYMKNVYKFEDIQE